ncbi:MAG: hypothetical protein ACP5N3_02075 [Candidatus Nanoarchaeia archaeon]
MNNSIFQVTINNIIKLFKKGNISDTYYKMYKRADKLASYEMNLRRDSFVREHIIDMKSKDIKSPHEYMLAFEERVLNYRDERLKYHMEEMKKLLELRLKEEKEK